METANRTEEKDVLILAIESSCDETAAAVVKITYSSFPFDWRPMYTIFALFPPFLFCCYCTVCFREHRNNICEDK